MPDDDWLDLRTTPYRTIRDLRDELDGDLVALGHYHYDHAMPPIPEQSSDQRLVFGFLISGLQRYRMDGEDLILRGGQGIRFLPGSVYSSADLPEQRGEFFWLVIHAPERRRVQLPGFYKKAAHSWWQRATDDQLPRRFPLSSEIRADLAHLIQSDVTNLDDKDSMHQTRLTLGYGSLLLSLYSLLGEPWENHSSKGILQALRLIENRLSDADLDTDSLAQEANISVSLFHVRFKEETGLPPADYLRHRRIIEAQRILSQPNPPAVTELAMKLGFSSSQYFATVFKRYTRLSPSEWSKRQA